MPIEVTIRPAKEGDLDAIATLSHRRKEQAVSYGLEANTPDYFRKNLGPLFLVAESDESIVAYILGTLRQADEKMTSVMAADAIYLKLLDVHVSDSEDTALRLLNQLQSTAKTMGACCSVLLQASPDNNKVSEMCHAQGYVSYGIDFFNRGEGCE